MNIDEALFGSDRLSSPRTERRKREKGLDLFDLLFAAEETGILIHHCPSCGAEIVNEERCPVCGMPAPDPFDVAAL